MKTIKSVLTLSIGILLFTSCNKGSLWGIYGKGNAMQRDRSVTAFTGINLNCDANVIYVQDSVYSLQVSAQENILPVLETKVSNSELSISFIREVRTHSGVLVTIHAPSLNLLSINGSGNITVQNTYSANLVSLFVNGSGSITIPTLNSSTIDSKISGSGNININGGTNNTAVYYINGSGNVNAISMQSKNTTAKISGSGNISINASDNLNVTISGSGDVRYKGKPAVTSQISGSGRLIRLD